MSDKINLHNHSTWSDGQHRPEHLVQMAIDSGLTHLGITDHFYTSKLMVPLFYVDADQIQEYAADLRRVADRFAPQIQVLRGIEVDWSPRSSARLPALWPHLNALDYVLFEYVADSEWYGDSLEALFTVLPEIHIPAGLAHNDLSQTMSRYTPEELVALLQKHDLFVELSTNPRTCSYANGDPYTVRLWQVLAESEVRLSIGSDTHGPLEDVARVEDAHRFLEQRGLLDRLITAWWDPAQQTWGERQI